ncbi:GGDEF domain-containing protein [Martelella radicis]|uniref:diguanylate cyclase n=1 Tax=Martelella radicis TaxID=1397476 RepID=A0A7W6PA38_9HYPH|nr:GGDEF domain-containing protein [Martelella radicis]MBB4122006.1 diguanylate cyclase (GGDEF)-like protein [Martelella radicis]
MDEEMRVRPVRRWLQSLSLRAWLVFGFLLALLPVILFSAVWYTQYRQQVAEPFRNVLHTQHRVLVSLERIQANLWDIAASVNDYANSGEEHYRNDFEAAERDIATHLRDLEQTTSAYPAFSPILEGVEQQWAGLLTIAASVEPDGDNADPTLIRFESVIAETGKRVEDIAETMRLMNEESHARALEVMRRLEIFAIIAGLLAICFAAAGIYIIDQALIRSTDKLVEGAMRVADGKRDREIDVRVPPELASVAQAFNAMLKQIVLQEERLAAAARADGLTGLDNRREFDRALDARIQSSRETNQAFALLLIDVDHFKAFNDSHGHLAGDDVLRQVADVLARNARKQDRAYRYGGEEFVMIMPGLRAYEAAALAERVRKAIAEHVMILPDGSENHITVSIGISVFNPQASQPDIVDLADKALYTAKTEGRNRVKVTA